MCDVKPVINIYAYLSTPNSTICNNAVDSLNARLLAANAQFCALANPGARKQVKKLAVRRVVPAKKAAVVVKPSVRQQTPVSAKLASRNVARK